MLLLIFLVVGFLIGSIPTGHLIARARGIDLRTVGSGNIGATNLGRALGVRWFLICTLLDALKGLVPTLVYALLAHDVRFAVPLAIDALEWFAVMLAPILGHVFCPWLGFKGGKGIATGLGALLAVFPIMTFAAFGALLVWLFTFSRTRTISIASIVAAFALAPSTMLGVAIIARSHRQDPMAMIAEAWPFTALSVGLALFVIYTHRANIARLRAGTEPKYTPKRGTPGTTTPTTTTTTTNTTTTTTTTNPTPATPTAPPPADAGSSAPRDQG